MNWKISLLLLIGFLILSCKENPTSKQEDKPAPQAKNTYYRSDHIMEAETLATSLKRPHLKLIDFRKEKGYNQGHIDGAINIWRSDIEDNSYPFGGMMAPKDKMEELLGNLGITQNDTLVVYDDRGSCDAARFWWVLKNYGFEKVKILNGGLDAWKELGGSVTTLPTETDSSSFAFQKKGTMELYIRLESIETSKGTSNPSVIIDTRTPDEFYGKRQKKGASRGGRIPGSILIDWVEAVDYDNNGKFKSVEELEKVYARLNLDKEDPIITYCHSGVRSAHTTFVLTELLGYKNVRNYDGSWTEWSYNEHLPIKADSTTTIFK